MLNALKKTSFLILLLLPFIGFSQSNSELYDKARDYAFEGQRDSARMLCERIVANDPENYTALILMGRTYAWDKMYPEARTTLRQAVTVKPNSTDAWRAFFDAQYWSKDFKLAEGVAREAIAIHPNEADFQVNLAKALSQQEKNKEAAKALDRALELEPFNEEAIKLRVKLKQSMRNSRIKLQHNIAMFYGSGPWHESLVELSHRLDRMSIIGRLGRAERRGRVDHLLEVDAYPKIRPGTYAFLSAGIGINRNFGNDGGDLYPVFRAGGELFQKLPQSFEASGGYRYLNFGSNPGTWIYTFSLGKYYRSYWFSARTYMTPKEGGNLSRSFYFFVREYFSNANDFFGITFGTGFSPDLNAFNNDAITDIQNLRAYSLRLERKWVMGDNWNAGVNVGYQNEQLSSSRFQNRYSAAASIQFNF